jgi:hypothetical protein
MPLPGFFFDTVGTGIRDMQREAARKAEIDQQRELEILQILALHGSDDVRGIAGTQWLELAKNPNRPRAKGLAGFLGQTQESPYFKDIQTAISSARVAQGPQPPSAGMSTNAPVSPGSQPITPAPAGPAPAPSQFSGLQTIPQPEERIQSGAPGTLGPAAAPEMAGPQGPAPIPTAPLVAPPPPQPKIRSPFPTAKEITDAKIAEQTALLNARYDAAAQAVQRYGGTPQQAQNAVLGMTGAPLGRDKPVALEGMINGLWTPIMQVGQEYFDSRGEQVYPEGIRKPGVARAPQDPTVRTETDDAGNVTAYVPPKLQPGQSVPIPGVRGRTRSAPNSPMSTFTGDPDGPGPMEPGTYARNRDGSRGQKLGDPVRPSNVDPQKVRYKVWKTAVDKAIKAITSKDIMTGELTLPTPQQIQEIITNETKQPGLTYDDLAMGAEGAPVAPRGARSGKTVDQVDRLIQSLNAASQRFAGSNASPVAPAPAPPPRR